MENIGHVPTSARYTTYPSATSGALQRMATKRDGPWCSRLQHEDLNVDAQDLMLQIDNIETSLKGRGIRDLYPMTMKLFRAPFESIPRYANHTDSFHEILYRVAKQENQDIIDIESLLGHCRAQNLRPEECSPSPLYHVLVDILRGVIHDHSASLVVNLGINLGISDQVDYPLLAFIF